MIRPNYNSDDRLFKYTYTYKYAKESCKLKTLLNSHKLLICQVALIVAEIIRTARQTYMTTISLVILSKNTYTYGHFSFCLLHTLAFIHVNGRSLMIRLKVVINKK